MIYWVITFIGVGAIIALAGVLIVSKAILAAVSTLESELAQITTMISRLIRFDDVDWKSKPDAIRPRPKVHRVTDEMEATRELPDTARPLQ